MLNQVALANAFRGHVGEQFSNHVELMVARENQLLFFASGPSAFTDWTRMTPAFTSTMARTNE